MVTVDPAVLPPVSVTDAGFSVQVAFCGAPVQTSATVPVEPSTGAINRGKVAVWPLVSTADEEPLTCRVKSSPLPASATFRVVARLAAVA